MTTVVQDPPATLSAGAGGEAGEVEPGPPDGVGREAPSPADLDVRTRAGHARWDAAAEEGRWVCDVTATDAPRAGCDCLACAAVAVMDWNAAQGAPDDLAGQVFGDWTTRNLIHQEPPRWRHLEDPL